ncbi:MAG: L-aspartate oxidase [Lachnospiraceae bacterium]|nr:L-aspartate oxidase [Lachnospiraceae bacterium]
MKTDILIVGTGAAGLFAALHMPRGRQVTLITKDEADKSDSFLAQGGICMLRNEKDYESYFEDTMKAGHYENDKESVDIMIRSSQSVIKDLIEFGVNFEHHHGHIAFTREGAHSNARILFHEDQTGKEITGMLLKRAMERDNIKIIENTCMLDIIENEENECIGVVVQNPDTTISIIQSKFTVFACGGVGGLYTNSTNFRHITGDAMAICKCHNIALKDMKYIQIHPTTLYSEKDGRRFLISESVRGEGAVLLNQAGNRFTDELQPRDVVAKAIREEMKKDNMPYEFISFENISEKIIRSHFPNIYSTCLQEGYDCLREPVPIVPAQHYFMGGIAVDYQSKTTMDRLYAIGETSCNGVHGRNRLASNSLLESMVFAQRAASEISILIDGVEFPDDISVYVDFERYHDIDALKEEYKKLVLDEIDAGFE